MNGSGDVCFECRQRGVLGRERNGSWEASVYTGWLGKVVGSRTEHRQEGNEGELCNQSSQA